LKKSYQLPVKRLHEEGLTGSRERTSVSRCTESLGGGLRIKGFSDIDVAYRNTPRSKGSKKRMGEGKQQQEGAERDGAKLRFQKKIHLKKTIKRTLLVDAEAMQEELIQKKKGGRKIKKQKRRRTQRIGPPRTPSDQGKEIVQHTFLKWSP